MMNHMFKRIDCRLISSHCKWA